MNLKIKQRISVLINCLDKSFRVRNGSFLIGVIKVGRRGVPNKTNKWETHIQPRLSEISQWLVDGEQVLDICKKLEIHHDTWYRYLKKMRFFPNWWICLEPL